MRRCVMLCCCLTFEVADPILLPQLDQHVAEMAADYFVELQVEGYNAALEGTLWLLPAAVGLVFRLP